jgi:hypothetical protein
MIHHAAVPLVVDAARLFARVIVVDLEGQAGGDHSKNGEHKNQIAHAVLRETGW